MLGSQRRTSGKEVQWVRCRRERLLVLAQMRLTFWCSNTKQCSPIAHLPLSIRAEDWRGMAGQRQGQEFPSQQDAVAGSTDAEIQSGRGRAWVSASQGILLWTHPAQLLKNSHICSPQMASLSSPLIERTSRTRNSQRNSINHQGEGHNHCQCS